MTFIDIIYGIIFEPVPTFKYLGGNKPLALGITAFSITAVLNMIINMSLNNPGTEVSLPGAYIGVYLCIGVLISIVILAASAAIYNLLGEIMYKQANGRGIMTCLAFACIPGILGSPLQYAFSLLNINLYFGISAITFIWVLALQVLALREALFIQTGQALMLLILPLIILIILLLAMIYLACLMLPGIF